MECERCCGWDSRAPIQFAGIGRTEPSACNSSGVETLAERSGLEDTVAWKQGEATGKARFFEAEPSFRSSRASS